MAQSNSNSYKSYIFLSYNDKIYRNLHKKVDSKNVLTLGRFFVSQKMIRILFFWNFLLSGLIEVQKHFKPFFAILTSMWHIF